MVRVKVDHWRAQQRRGAGLKTMYAPAPALSTTATPDATSSSSTSRTVTGGGSCIDLTLDDDDDDDSEDDDEPLVVVPAPQPAASQAVESVGSDEGEDEDEAYPPLKLTGDGDGDDHESEEDEELPRRASDAAGRNDSTAAATPTADTTTTRAESAQRGEDADDDEVLEDGEIFEEGAVIASPTRVKQAIALERMASRAAEAAAPRQKKQKKRGKKKSKRKVEAMLMMAGGDASPGFERNTRHQPFLASPPPPPLHPPSAAPHPVAPLDGAAAPLEPRRSEVGNMRMMFGGAPHPPLPLHPPPPGVHGAPFGMHGPRHGHAPIHGDAPFVPFPPFADDQILRVNRHGSVEMFNSVEYPRGGSGPPPPRHPPANPAVPPHVLGGFKYRAIPKAVRVLQVSDSTSGSSTSSGSSSSNSNQSPDGKESTGDFDLDNLRAAALRTKRPSKVLEGEEKVDAASSDPAIEKSSTTVTTPMEGADEPLEAATPSIDDLRAEILRSMMVNKKKTAVRSTGNAAHVKQSSLEKEVPSKSSSGFVEQQRSEGAEARLVSTDSTIPPLPAPSAPSVPPAPSAPPSPSILAPQAITSGSIRVASSSPPPVSAPIRVTEFSSLPVPASPPRFRPLTASTQSIVICLSPEDYSKSTKNGDAGQGGTSNSNNSTIQSAIEEMRKKIAEKEKLRNGNRVGEPAGDEAPKRSAPLPSSGSAMAQGSDKSGVDATPSHAVMKSSLQAKIEEMKKSIAAKEMEKRGSSAPPSLTATASNSPRGGSPTNTAATANKSVSLPPTTKSGVDPQTASEAEKCVAGSVEAQAGEQGADHYEELARAKPEEYERLYRACVSDYEEAQSQVTALDAAIARLRQEIVSLEPPSATAVASIAVRSSV